MPVLAGTPQARERARLAGQRSGESRAATAAAKRLDEAVEAVVARAPELSPAQRDRLAAVFATAPQGENQV